MGLLLVGSAVADTGNSVYIDQTNADNSTVSITQSGQGNMVGDPNNFSTPQFAIDGNNMALTVTQDGVGNALTGNFIGGDSTASINQTGNFNTVNLNYGNMGSNGGTLNIGITGDTNAVGLNIGTTNNASNYNYTLGVTGNSNSITSNINSKNTNDSFTVNGSSNTITTTQIGVNGTPMNVYTLLLLTLLMVGLSHLNQLILNGHTQNLTIMDL